MSIRGKIIFGFSLIIILLSAMGIFLIYSMQKLANEAGNIYKHPFTVSNAAKNIEIHLLSIQDKLKDAILPDSENRSRGIEISIRRQKGMILEDFGTIKDRYLGPEKDVENALTAYNSWLDVTEDVIFLQKQGKTLEASQLIETRLSQDTERFRSAMDNLIAFATGKANEFYTKTLDNKKDFLIILSFLLITSIGASVFIMTRVVSNHDFTLKEINRYLHLVDQNILIASMNKKGKITDISNALCRFLGNTKTEMIGTQCNFFVDQKMSTGCTDHIYKVIQTGSEWEGDLQREDANGDPQWINLTIHPVFDENFNISSYSHIIQDVTDKKKLEELSVTDKLTMLHNRRYFDTVLEREIKLAHRNEHYLTLAIADIDFFKKYNDHYGHPAGDEILATVARVLKKVLNRPNDYLFRLGGEEFGILFANTNHDRSIAFLEKIKDAVESLEIKHEYNDVSSYVTISIGARVLKGLDIPAPNLFYVQADQALYEAKKNRNQVVVPGL